MQLSRGLTRIIVLLSLGASLAAAAPAARPAAINTPAVYHWPLDWNPLGFIGNHTIGTPPQEVSTFVDITWIGNYFLTTKCKGKVNNVEECFLPDQGYFNESKSSTFSYQPQYPSLNWNPNHFFFWKDLSVDIAKDVVEVGGVKTETIIQAADFAFTQDFPYPFHGVYGLSPVLPGDNSSTTSPFYQAWKAGHFASGLSAFHYCYPGKRKATCQGHDAIQTLGGYDPARVKGNIRWYDVIHFPEVNVIDFEYHPAVYNYWTLNLTGLSIGNEKQAINKTHGAGAVFDHASYGRGAPLSENAYARLIAIAGATPVKLADPWSVNNGNQTFHSIPCWKKYLLPDLKYWFEDDKEPWIIKSRNYVDEVEGKCVLNVRTLGYGDMIIGNFGETFNRDKYTILDFENLRVGISNVAW
ncbi:eukaryotic aspartyl protease [Kalaharituber pfeilii]|nr:eukaryotic aspartyl protease [Kalaharituber pfeilii]